MPSCVSGGRSVHDRRHCQSIQELSAHDGIGAIADRCAKALDRRLQAVGVVMRDRIASEDVARLTVPDVDRAQWRNACRNLVLQNALRKRSAGVPTYSVPEAAALMSVSQEHLYRLIRAGAFPALRMRLGQKGRYVVPARAVEALLDAATDANTLIDVEASTSTSFFGGTP